MIASSSDHFNFCAKYSQLSSIPSSPERRFKNISPCRRLFEELSTNQNSPSPNGFVVGNGAVYLATPNTSFSNNNKNKNNSNNYDNVDDDETDNNGNSNHSIFGNLNDAFAVTKDDKLGAVFSTSTSLTVNNNQFASTVATHSSINTTTSNNNNNNFVIEGLTDILYSSYQRRRNLNFNTNTTNSININNSHKTTTSYNNINNCVSSPFMDDLGFLSQNNANIPNGTGNFNIISSGDMKKNPSLIIFENDELGSDENVLMSSPMKSKDVPMKPCSIRKSQMHWNRMATSPTLRRSFSESCSLMTAQISENGLIHHLPCSDSPHDAIKRISPDTLVQVLEGRFGGLYERLFVIDCRYPYEYEGGHIPTAINVNAPEVIEKLLMESPQANTLIVFHCEFSSERAPRMALHVRNLDRQLNKANYPNLFYPEMYILDGGYKNFWQQHPIRCDPPNAYLPMRNPQFRDQLRHHQKMKHAFKSGFHLSQHSAIKQLPPKSKKTRSKSLNVANARKFFNDLISKTENPNEQEGEEEEESESLPIAASKDSDSLRPASVAHMFPSYSIPMANSFSSIFASEIDISSEMDMEE